MVIEIHTEREASCEKPRLDEGNQEVLPLGADLHTQPELLSATGEGRRIEQIKVALVDLGEAHDGIHRAEPCADSEVTGALLIHSNHQVLPVGHRGGFRAGVHLLKVVQPLKPLLAQVHAHHVEHFARRDRQFPADYLVASLGVATDLDLLDVGFLSFVDPELQIHRARFGIRNPKHREVARGGRYVDVPFRAVKVLHSFDVAGEALGSEGGAHVHRQAVRAGLHVLVKLRESSNAVGDIAGAEEAVARKRDGAHFVLAAFVDQKIDLHRLRSRIHELDIFDLEIDVTVLAVILAQLLPIVLELLVLEVAAPRYPGEHPMLPRLDDFAQLALFERLRADEADLGYLYLPVFLDLERRRAASGLFIDYDLGRDLRRGIPRLLVHLLNVLAVREELSFIEGFPGL